MLKRRIIDTLIDETLIFDAAIVTPDALDDIVHFIENHDDFRNENHDDIINACRQIIDELTN